MKIIILKQHIGKRIDSFLSREFFSFTRGEIIRKIKAGEVLANDKKIKPSYILKEEDVITIVGFEKIEKKLIPNKNIEYKIIFKDKNIIVIDKPAGIKVHPNNFSEKETLVNGLLAKFPEIENVDDGSHGAELRPGIVHRLDKDTSGVMVVARNQKSFDELKKCFKNRTIEKWYVAICEGLFEEKKGIIEKDIAKASNYKKQVIAHKNTITKIRAAVTIYKVVKEKHNFSIVEVSPKTGRMHQIRIHMASMGHPVVGDVLYGNANSAAKRQLLHAKRLRFSLFGEKYDFLANIPQDFKDFLASIKA